MTTEPGPRITSLPSIRRLQPTWSRAPRIRHQARYRIPFPIARASRSATEGSRSARARRVEKDLVRRSRVSPPASSGIGQVPDDGCRISRDECVGRNGLRHYRTRCDYRVVADRYPTHDDAVNSDPDVSTDHNG